MRWIRGFLITMMFVHAGATCGESCSVTATPASFGNYDTTSPAPMDTVAEITVSCETGIPYLIKLDPGQNAQGEFDRKLRSTAGDSTLQYNLYRDSARTEVWGDGTGNTFTRNGIGVGVPDRANVYGRIPGRQNVKADAYNDSIVITVEW